MSEPCHDPLPLYSASQVRAFDQRAIDTLPIAGIELMRRAGAAAFELLRERWPRAEHLAILCGPGNNGGDGYVVATLAREAGLAVSLISLVEPERLRGAAQEAMAAWRESGGTLITEGEAVGRLSPDLWVDGLLGTGLERPLDEGYARVVTQVNASPAPVLALDIPSGLHADTGQVLGVAMEAELTLSFIAAKLGLYVGRAADHCGEVQLAGLGLPERIFTHTAPQAHCWRSLPPALPPRARSAHKGQCGHLLIVGGHQGMSGAARLAAEAGARSGAGLVSVATHPQHAPFLNQGRPELMVRGVSSGVELDPLLQRASVVAIGPGLGREQWSQQLWRRVIESPLPKVVDADGLNLLAENPQRREDWILTPHPGEAARLLGCTVAEIEADRLAAAEQLRQRYGGAVVLKGAGSCMALTQGVEVCALGNPGMASGGMGDLLTGMIGALWGQGLARDDALRQAVCLHGAAADRAAVAGERGLLASDLLPELRPLLNRASFTHREG